MFLFRLALGLGMTVAELEQRMGSSELQEWMLFWRAEPWGPYRDNIHAGLIASILANIHRKKSAPAVTYQEFMLVDPVDHKNKKTRETLAWMKAVARRKNRNGG